MSKFRVKEVALNKDGTDIWFYPEVLVKREKTKGKFWWKSVIEEQEWERYYYHNSNRSYVLYSEKEASDLTMSQKEEVVAFRTLDEASIWHINHIKEFREKNKQENEKWWKYLGGRLNNETVKTHELKID